VRETRSTTGIREFGTIASTRAAALANEPNRNHRTDSVPTWSAGVVITNFVRSYRSLPVTYPPEQSIIYGVFQKSSSDYELI